MYLIDLLSNCNEAMVVRAYTETRECGVYDGKNSIPDEFNWHRVLNITATGELKLGVLVTEEAE